MGACLVQPLLGPIAFIQKLIPTTSARIPRHTVRINVHRVATGHGAAVVRGDMSKMWCGERLALEKRLWWCWCLCTKWSTAPSSYFYIFFYSPQSTWYWMKVRQWFLNHSNEDDPGRGLFEISIQSVTLEIWIGTPCSAFLIRFVICSMYVYIYILYLYICVCEYFVYM